MDRGQLFKSEFVVVPGENGSFIIRMARYYNDDPMGSSTKTFGFTTLPDLLHFLSDEAVSQVEQQKQSAGD